MGENFKLWHKIRPLDDDGIALVPPDVEGVYIVYHDASPFYVGRSIDMQTRLRVHYRRRGSRKIREALEGGASLKFTFAEIGTCEQAEAILLEMLNTIELGNLRRETDPAERWAKATAEDKQPPERRRA